LLDKRRCYVCLVERKAVVAVEALALVKRKVKAKEQRSNGR